MNFDDFTDVAIDGNFTMRLLAALTGPNVPDESELDEAARQLRAVGFSVTSSHEELLPDGFEDAPELMRPLMLLGHTIEHVLEADVILTMPGWDTCPFAKRMFGVGVYHGKRVASLDSVLAATTASLVRAEHPELPTLSA